MNTVYNMYTYTYILITSGENILDTTINMINTLSHSAGRLVFTK